MLLQDNQQRVLTIQLQTEDRSAVVQTWKLLRARIVKHSNGPFDARGNLVAMEELMLAYERLEGSVVRSDDVRLAAFKAARHARDLLLAMPDRLAPLIAATTDPAEVHRLLVAEINRACDELKRPLIVRGPDGKPRSL